MMFPDESMIIDNNGPSSQLQQRKRFDIPSSTSSSTPPISMTGLPQSSPSSSVKATAPAPPIPSQDNNNNELSAEQFIQKQIQQLRNELDLLIAIPFLLLLSYGGRPSILILSFGSMACYILDILESIEGSLIAFFILMIAFLGTLIYATREAIQESIYNLLLLPAFTFSTIIFFIVGIAHFNLSFNEYSIFMNILVQVLFAISPLLFGALIAAILSDDILEIDLQTCFTFCYFGYSLYYCRPRYLYRLQFKKIGSKITAPFNEMRKQLMIPPLLLPVIYISPIVISFLLQLSLHHNVLSTDRYRIISMIQSILLPTILMCFCYQQHSKQLQRLSVASSERAKESINSRNEEREDLKILFKWFYRGLLGIYAIFLVEHPFFDEMKHFSHVPIQLANYLFMALVLFFFLIFFLVEKIHEYKLAHFTLHSVSNSSFETYDDISPYNTNSRQFPILLSRIFGVNNFSQVWFTLLRFGLDLCVGCTFGLIAFLFHFPSSLLPVAVIGSMSLVELHFFQEESFLNRLLLVVIVSLSLTVSFITFTKGTIFYLYYSFQSYFWGNFQLSQFSWFVTGLISFAAVLPVFISSKKNKHHASSLSDIPVSDPRYDDKAKGLSADDIEDPKNIISSTIFSTGVISLLLMVTWLELTVLEQDWSGIEVTSEIVYPIYFFLLTAGLSLFIGYILYTHGSIGFTTFGNICIIQLTKMLYFFHQSSYLLLPFSILLISNFLPFFRQYSYYQRYLQENQSFDDLRSPLRRKLSPLLAWNEIIVYIILNAVLYYVFSFNISKWLLGWVFSFFENTFTGSAEEEEERMASDLLFGVNREISNWQILLFSLALYLVYLCSILYVFQRRLKSIRSILMGISVILIMLSFEGFGLLRFNSSNDATTTDTQTVLTNSGLANQHFLSTYDHSTFFMLLTIILTVIAWMRFIALDNLFTCLFYSIIFGFISTKAMINWAFPYHMLVSHQFHHHHRHGTNNQEVYYYPFFFLFILKVLNTFISLWNPKNSSHSITFTYIFPLLYLITLLWPFMNLIISYILLENQDIDGLLAEMREREDIGASAGRESFTSSLPTITNKYTIYTGIILSTLIGNLTLTGSFRLKEVLNYMNDPRETIYSSRIMISFLYPFSSHTATTAAAAGSSIRSHGYSIVLFNCFITILWAFIVIAFQITSIDYDLFFPVICAIILIYDNEIEVNRIPFFSTLLQWFITKKKKVTPLHLWTLLIVAFWYASWFYHIFIMDLPLFTNTSSEDINASYFKHLAYLINLKPYSWMNFDSNVSIWSTEHWITPTLTIIYGIFTIPAIYYSIWNATSYAVKKTNQYTTEMTGTVSDDVLFLLSLFALIPVIGGHIDCLRYLGLIGGIYGIYRSNYLFRKEKLSSQYL